MDSRLISATFVQPIPEICTTRGCNPVKLFDAVGLNIHNMNDPSASLKVNDYGHLLQLCALKLEKPHFGLLVGSSLTPQMLGAFGLRLHYSQTMGDGLRFLEQHFRRVQQAVDISIRQTGRTFIVKISLLDEHVFGSSHLIETLLSLLVSWIRRCYRSSWEPIKVYFNSPLLEKPHDIKSYFGCPVIANSSFNGLEYTAESHNAQLQHSDPALCFVLEEYMEHQIDLSQDAEDLKILVADAIAGNLESQELHVKSIAKLLGFSPRTLQRRLDQENIKFSNLVSTVRHDTACKLLRLGSMSVSEVAFKTGYSDVSAFSRAFQKWEGVSPSQFR